MKHLPKALGWLLVFLCLLRAQSGRSQAEAGVGSVFGQITEAETAEGLGGATVTIEGAPFKTESGSDGNYVIQDVPPGYYQLLFNKVGYDRRRVDRVEIKAGEATRLNAELRLELYELEPFEVVADPFSGLDAGLILERQEDPVFKNAIGSEMISQLGLGDAAEAVGKITGASVADGKYAVIRGLGDRYTSTMLNGTDFPSADPNRKAAQLDLIPSQFIDRLDVSKTFSPDLPGGFAGGAINIVTKRYPEEFLFNFKLGASYNTQSSFNDDFLESDQGGTDWLAVDDGKRELPPEAANTPPNSSQDLGQAIKGSFGSRQFAPVKSSSPMDSSLALAIGDSTNVAGRRLGYLAGLSYDVDYDFYDNGRILKYDNGGTNINEDKTDTRATITYTWGAMASLSFELAENHNLGFNVLHVQTAEDEARRLVGFSEAAATDPDNGTYLEQSSLAWTERALTYYQLLGEHVLPALHGTEFDWVAAISSTSQEEPDFRVFQFVADPANGNYSPFGPGRPERPNRSWREIYEDAQSFKGDLTVPLPSYNSEDNNLKLGGSYNASQRDYEARYFDVRANSNNTFFDTGDPNDYLSEENEGSISYRNFAAFSYQGEQEITGGYAMADWAALDWLRLVGGARVEHTMLTVDTANLRSGQQFPSASVDQTDVLPSISATIFLRENLQLRAAWSQTLVRPIYREISRAPVYDVALARTVQGNENTSLGESENIDFRIDYYPREGSLISASVFRKNITGPIELIQIARAPDLYQYTNYSVGTVQGVEFEMRDNLGNWWESLDAFSLGFNFALIESEVPLFDFERFNRSLYGEDGSVRPLYDQPDYVVNGDLTWSHPEWGATVTVSAGVVGERLVAAGTFDPDEYLQPAPTLDLFYTQALSENWKLKLSAKNLLNPKYEVHQSWPDAGDLPISSYRKGMSFGLSMTYSY